MAIVRITKEPNLRNSTIRKLVKSGVHRSYHQIDIFKKALNEADALSFTESSDCLKALIEAEQANIGESLGQRRETPLTQSRNIGLSVKCFGDFDRIDIFKVSYKENKIRREVGSEAVAEFGEFDGTKRLERIQDKRIKRDNSALKRERIFRFLQYSHLWGQREIGSWDQWLPIRRVYSHLALPRHLDADGFVKALSQKSFTSYTTAQFVFDLARFGCVGQTRITIGGSKNC